MKWLESRDHMSLTAGIVGMPNVGKSTLFNAITNSQVEAANYPFATIKPNTGVVEVPDKRLDYLCQLYHPLRRVAATFEFTDIAGLVKGASKGEGLGNQFLANIRETDAICHVVRCFEDPNILHVDGSVNSLRDAETINLELIFADLETIENRIAKIEKKATTSKEKNAVEEYEILKRIRTTLMANQPVRSIEFTPEQARLVKSFHLLTNKPMIYVANMGENDIANFDNNKEYQALKKQAALEKAGIIPICAKIEDQLASLDEEERLLFMDELGMQESGLSRLIKATYQLLGLETFYTSGKDECRAWTFKKGMKAPQCAGIIHTDFERGFIKAEIYNYEDLIQYGTETAVKENGKYRLEGKEYLMKDGDIAFFKFNV